MITPAESAISSIICKPTCCTKLRCRAALRTVLVAVNADRRMSWRQGTKSIVIKVEPICHDRLPTCTPENQSGSN